MLIAYCNGLNLQYIKTCTINVHNCLMFLKIRVNFSVRIFISPNYEPVKFIVKIKAVAKHLKLSRCLSSASNSQF